MSDPNDLSEEMEKKAEELAKNLIEEVEKLDCSLDEAAGVLRHIMCSLEDRADGMEEEFDELEQDDEEEEDPEGEAGDDVASD